jgi:molecular chaperone GrpE (heat shock protein)
VETNARTIDVSTNRDKSPGYFVRLLSALLGRQPAPAAAAAPDDRQYLELQARAAALETDLRQRDERIAQMKSEYDSLQAAKDRAEVAAGESRLERLFRSLSGPLANLTTLCALADAGQQLELGDLVGLIRSLEKELARAGLEPIGRVGQEAPFDVATHQRMSGGAVRPGAPVTVQLPGYRLGDKILLKAMVSAQQDAPRQEEGNG